MMSVTALGLSTLRLRRHPLADRRAQNPDVPDPPAGGMGPHEHVVSVGSGVGALADLHVFRSAEGIVLRGSHVYHSLPGSPSRGRAGRAERGRGGRLRALPLGRPGPAGITTPPASPWARS